MDPGDVLGCTEEAAGEIVGCGHRKGKYNVCVNGSGLRRCRQCCDCFRLPRGRVRGVDSGRVCRPSARQETPVRQVAIASGSRTAASLAAEAESSLQSPRAQATAARSRSGIADISGAVGLGRRDGAHLPGTRALTKVSATPEKQLKRMDAYMTACIKNIAKTICPNDSDVYAGRFIASGENLPLGTLYKALPRGSI